MEEKIMYNKELKVCPKGKINAEFDNSKKFFNKLFCVIN